MHRHPVLTAVTALSAVMALGAAVAAADVVDGYCITYRAPADTFPQTLDATANTLDDRLGSMGIAGHAVAEPGSGTITVQLKPGPTDLAAMTDLAADLGATGILEFVPVPPELQFVVVEGPVPDGMQEMNPLLTGVEIDSASIVTDDTTGETIIDLRLDATGARLFDEYAEEHLGEQFAVVLDDEVVSAPVIQATSFDGHAQISTGRGSIFGPSDAQALVAAILSGVMPVELTVDDIQACAVLADLDV